MSANDDSFHSKIVVDVEAVTDRAILILTEDGQSLWLPKSCTTDLPNDLARGQSDVELKVVNWWLDKEGLL